jgi:hypothetical protein
VGGVRIEEVKKEETTTTEEDDWVVVVSLLEEVGVGRIEEAIERAKSKGRTATEVASQIQELMQREHTAGLIYNQVCNPSRPTVKPVPKRAAVLPEVRRAKAYQFLRGKLGRIPSEAEIDSLLGASANALV